MIPAVAQVILGWRATPFVGLAVALVACASLDPEPAWRQPLPALPDDVPFKPFQDPWGVLRPWQAVTLVFHDQEEWSAFYEDDQRRGNPDVVMPAPTVDFANDLLLLVATGDRPSGGYAIDIKAVGQVGDALEVSYAERQPGNECGVTLAVTQPVALATLPRTNRSITFTHHVIVEDCAAPDHCGKAQARADGDFEALRRCVLDADCTPRVGEWPFCSEVINPSLDDTSAMRHQADFCALNCGYPCQRHPCLNDWTVAAQIKCIGRRCEAQRAERGP